MCSEGIKELENARMHCTDDDENNNEMDGIEVIDLCSVSRCRNDAISEEKKRNARKPGQIETRRNGQKVR